MIKKIVTATLLSVLVTGCATNVSNNSKSKTVAKTTTAKKTTAKKPQASTSKKAPSKVSQSKSKTQVSAKKPKEIEKPKSVVVTKDVVESGTKVPALSKPISSNNKFWEEDKRVLMQCEKDNDCLKELVVINGEMVLSININPDVYNVLKDKNNAITYFNNDVRIFKSKPDFYLKKYGAFSPVVKNTNELLMNLKEVQIKDLFYSDILIRFKPF